MGGSGKRGKRMRRRGAPVPPMGMLSRRSLACTDADLASPEKVKYWYATYAASVSPGREKLAAWEDACERGPLGPMPDIKDWAQEEYLYHGIPGDAWSPMSSYLDYVGDRLSESGRRQLQRWQEAQFGFFLVGEVKDDLVSLSEYDLTQAKPIGEPIGAVTPGIGGASFFLGQKGKLVATYLAPWLPERNIHCAMGYGTLVPKDNVGLFALLLGLRRPDLVGTPLPWNKPNAQKTYHTEWQKRDWWQWMNERLIFPFRALVMLPPLDNLQPRIVQRLIPATTEEARLFGVYAEVRESDESVIVAGLSNIVVADIASPNFLPFVEYGEYRRVFGPPPGTRNEPRFVRLR